MKKTFLAILMAGCSMAMFAQTTPPTTPTTPTTEPTTTPTTPPATTTPTVPMTQDLNSNTNNQITTSTSTSWSPVTAPYSGWNSYGLWNMNMYPTPNAPATTDVNGNLSSIGTYSALGTSVAALPSMVQMRFNSDFPTTANTAYSWSQYGDWFHTHYVNNGRATHYFYNARGDGYSLALPVIQTYVPEEIIDKALQKYGANLYSVSMVKVGDGSSAYQLGLIEKGQMRTVHLKEDGSSVEQIWRIEEDTLSTTDANAAMDGSGTTTTTEMTTATETPATSDEKETKMKWKENGVKTKIKSGDGKTKIKQKQVDD